MGSRVTEVERTFSDFLIFLFKHFIRMKFVCVFVVLLFCLISTAFACIGDGCVHDRMEERFYWISTRETENADLVKELNGPEGYCNSLGLVVTQSGSSLWLRALELEKKKFGDNTVKGNAKKVICHEQIWN